MNRFDREIRRRQHRARKRKAYALYRKYTLDTDIQNCMCKNHGGKQ